MMSAKKFEIGDLVWAKMKGHLLWPAEIIEPPRGEKLKSHHYVLFLCKGKRAWISDANIDFHSEQHLESCKKKRSVAYQSAIDKIVSLSKDRVPRIERNLKEKNSSGLEISTHIEPLRKDDEKSPEINGKKRKLPRDSEKCKKKVKKSDEIPRNCSSVKASSSPAAPITSSSPAAPITWMGPAEPITLNGPAAPSTSKAPTAISSLKGPTATSNSKGPAAPSSSKVPAAPSSSKVPAAPSSSKVPAAPSSSKVPAAPSSSKVPAAPSSSKVPAAPISSKVPAAPISSKVPAAPISSKVPAAPISSKVPAAPNSSKGPAAPSSSKGPAAPSTSNCPAAPSTSKGPIAPSTSKGPTAPSTSKGPTAPSTSKGPTAPSTTRRIATRRSALLRKGSICPPKHMHLPPELCAEAKQGEGDSLFGSLFGACETPKLKHVPPTSKKIGFLGLGAMGSRMVKKLIESGHNVTVWNRTQSKCREFVKLGAKSAASPAAVSCACDIIFSCLSDAAVAKSVVLAPNGVLKGMEVSFKTDPQKKAYKGYVEMTSLNCETSIEIAEAINVKGGKYIEAPITGSRQLAEEGSLLILASGSRELFDDCETCFHAIASHLYFVGCRIGESTKYHLTISTLAGTAYAAMAEALSLAERLDVSKKDFIDILQLKRLAPNHVLEKGEKMICNDIVPVTALKYQQQDMALALEMSHIVSQPMPVTAAANEVFKHARLLGYDDFDISTIFLGTKY